MPAATTRSIADQLPRLRAAVPATRRVLSVYLDTPPRRADKGAFLLAFRDSCKQIRASLDSIELEPFERSVEQAERFMTGQGPSDDLGLALLASGADDYLQALPLPRRVANEVAWGEQPLLAPLETVLDD